MKKFLTIILLLVVIISLTGCDNVDKSSDAYQFKEEYESLNGEDNGNGKTIRTVEIPVDNPMKYASTDEIVEKMENKESFVVYFGFAKCPWCRSMIEEFIRSAQDNKIDTIYYVDVLEVRDMYQLDDEGVVQQVKEGTKGYMKLIDLMGDVLSDYTLEKDGEKVEVGEKRIYAPNVVAVVDGQAEKMVEGTSEKLTDPYMKLTEEMKEESYKSFKCLWECLEADATTCQKNTC
ncbi:MAG: hypothetical protein J6X28_00290 [Bacilli bacterium]|nr:hypothetical protein [Bacilli bacterium]